MSAITLDQCVAINMLMNWFVWYRLSIAYILVVLSLSSKFSPRDELWRQKSPGFCTSLPPFKLSDKIGWELGLCLPFLASWVTIRRINKFVTFNQQQAARTEVLN